MPRQCAEKVRVTFNAHFWGVLYTNGVSVIILSVYLQGIPTAWDDGLAEWEFTLFLYPEVNSDQKFSFRASLIRNDIRLNSL